MPAIKLTAGIVIIGHLLVPAGQEAGQTYFMPPYE
jgi:hypothetical protein